MRRSIPLLLLALVALPACVTERTTKPTYGPPTAGASRSGPRNPSSPADASVALPEGPVARPVKPEATASSRVRTALLDLGAITYDGQVLPLVSPDGRFLAAQSGQAPTWATLLAAPGAEVPHAASVHAYSLPNPVTASPSTTPDTPPPTTARQLGWQPKPGLVLGRSCDASGFLVESPQPDGSRWIGYVEWVSGDVKWLVKDAGVNAYSVLGPEGEFAFCRRAVDSIEVQLVVRSSKDAEREVTAAPSAAGGRGGAYMWPMFTDEPGVVYAFALVSGGIELHALKIPQRGDPPILAVVARQPLSRNASAASIYQMAAAQQVPAIPTLTMAGGNTQQNEHFDKLLFFHVGQRRMCVFDRRLGAVTPLTPGSIAAVPVVGDSGYLITTREGLEFVPWSQKSDFERSRGGVEAPEGGVSVVKGAYVARLTRDPVWTAVLLGPSPRSAGSEIHLFRLRLEGAGGAAESGR